MKPADPCHLPLAPARLAALLGVPDRLTLSLARLTELRAALAAGDLTPANQLTPAELTRYNGYHFEKRRLEWLGGRLAAKQAAARLFPGSAPESWEVANGDDGHPFFRPAEGKNPIPALSISHSHDLAAALVVAGHPCGFDLQRITETVVRVREKFCREAETELLGTGGIDPGSPAESLTLLWSAKEALRKGLGGQPLVGFLTMGLTRIEKIADQVWLFTLKIDTGRAPEHLVATWWLEDYAASLTIINR